jgi:hypothetical protein
MSRRSLVDESVRDVRAWIAASLDEEVRPDAVMVWQTTVRLERSIGPIEHPSEIGKVPPVDGGDH